MDDIPPEIAALIDALARLPGFGPRSARRAALHLLGRRSGQMTQLARALATAAETVRDCTRCGNLSSADLCPICAAPRRANGQLCVVEDVAALWAMERGGIFGGRYHVLGGTLSALDGVGPEDLRLPALPGRLRDESITEVILALGATVAGQTTAHYIADLLEPAQITLSSLGQGVPVGGELDYLDEGTIAAALRARRSF